MGQKSNKKKVKTEDKVPPVAVTNEYSPKTEHIYKMIVRIMSWIVGIAAGIVLILPEFNSGLLDQITKTVFQFAFSVMLVFLVIEFIREPVKKIIESQVRRDDGTISDR